MAALVVKALQAVKTAVQRVVTKDQVTIVVGVVSSYAVAIVAVTISFPLVVLFSADVDDIHWVGSGCVVARTKHAGGCINVVIEPSLREIHAAVRVDSSTVDASYQCTNANLHWVTTSCESIHKDVDVLLLIERIEVGVKRAVGNSCARTVGYSNVGPSAQGGICLVTRKVYNRGVDVGLANWSQSSEREPLRLSTEERTGLVVAIYLISHFFSPKS